MIHPPHIAVDHRERPSGIPKLLQQEGCEVAITTLNADDYVIEDLITIERNTAEDFVLSIIQQRLFAQCKKLKNQLTRSIMIIEGNPYKTGHQIKIPAVKGAVLAVTAGWQLPVLRANDKQATVAHLIAIARQLNEDQGYLYSNIPVAYKPRKMVNRQIHFINGPGHW